MMLTNQSSGLQAPLSAAILAGGRSSRMGTDKALIALDEKSQPLLVQTADRARIVAGDVFVVASDRPEYAAFGLPVVHDEYQGGGTLGAIATALERARFEHCLVVACDLPFLNGELLRMMAGMPRTYDVLVPRTTGESRQGRGTILHTLHAIYSRRCLPSLLAYLTSGRRQIVGFFDSVRVQPIDEGELRRFDPELRSFFNANTPEALAQARTWLRRPE